MKDQEMSLVLKKVILSIGIVLIIVFGGLAANKIFIKKEDKPVVGIDTAAASQIKLPEYFDTASPDIKEAYQFSISRPDVLEQMACYCGCGRIGHKSNKSCFIKEIKEDGTIILDDHGTVCDICLDVALTTKHLMSQGITLKEIRKTLDKKYAGKPSTDTPYPSE